MYGPIESGKTSILRRLTERLGTAPRYTVAYVISPNVRRANTFLKIIMDAFDVPAVRSYDNNQPLRAGAASSAGTEPVPLCFHGRLLRPLLQATPDRFSRDVAQSG